MGMDGDGDNLETCGDRGWMGIRVTGTVGDGYKYLFPCSSLLQLHWGCALGRNDTAASVLGS